MQQLRDFWQQQHQQKNRGSLSGCSLDDTVDFLQLQGLCKPGARFLEIGVGLGYVTRGLATMGSVSAVDISEHALQSVQSVCEHVWQADRIHELPNNLFDVAICHNVAQHVPTDMLRHELTHVIRSLRPDGILALEYVWHDDHEDTGQDPEVAACRGGYLCRSDRFMTDMIAQLGGQGRVVHRHRIQHGKNKINGVSVMHIQKSDYFKNQRVLITGGTGSWGQTLARRLLAQDIGEVVVFSRGELQQVQMQRDLRDPRLKFVIGDVRDYDSLSTAMRGVDTVFHLAALKHVPICEDHPQEAIKTNIQGTTNVVNAAIANRVNKVVDVSTDKAVEPLNLYGMTKSVGEKLILQANALTDHTRFVCIRGGNVMGSNGSVIPYFIQQIQRGGPLTITDADMTRFFLTLGEAIELLFKAAEHSVGGETFVMNMPACRITDVAEVLMQRHGRVPIEYIGSKPGEKLHEMLISSHEAVLSRCYDENYFVILPARMSPTLQAQYQDLPAFPHAEFSSATKLMDLDHIRLMLTKGAFV